ncbi:MAG: PAS domain S-box protein [Archangiaceae bacterium]|nr:PAS domain S-box protein [Archangiaceae bacterium]
MHPLLARQLKRYFKAGAPTDAAFTAFVQAVSDAYRASDDDSALLEHSLKLASAELEERYHTLQKDIAERERVQGERDAFFRASPDMLSVIDRDLRIVLANPSWQRVLGYDPAGLVGANFLDTIHPEDVSRITGGAQSLVEQTKAGVEQATVRDFEFRQRTASGEWRTISAAATIDGQRGLFFAVGRDVTSQRSMARELEQTHRLEAVGQLAAGMAHEINTPIQYVGDNVQFAGDGFESLDEYLQAVDQVLQPQQRAALKPAMAKADLEYLKEELPRSLSEAKDGVRRVAELVRALKEFAHPDQGEKSHADINKALERALIMARGELRHVTRVETQFGELPPLRCHIGSLSQVFLNLLVNAAHAVEERTAKQGVAMADHRVTVRTRLDGDDVVISITDTGCGIPANIRERIFEPFFTTKPMGKGSGQGLPLVRNVVIQKHGGRVEVESEVNVGTTFTLRLPLESSSQVGKAA